MDVLYVMAPVQACHIEVEDFPLLGRQRVQKAEGVLDSETAVQVQVRFVDFSVVIELFVGGFQSRQAPLEALGTVDTVEYGEFVQSHGCRVQRNRPESMLQAKAGRLREAEIANVDRPPRLVEHGVSFEVAIDEVVEVAQRDGIAGPGGHLVNLDPRCRGCCGKRRQQGVHHHVHGHQVDDDLGAEGQSPKAALADGGDERVGHPKALEPTRARLGKAALDDGRANDDGRSPVPGPQHHLFPDGLGIGVSVVPTPLPGPTHPLLGELVLSPFLAQVLDLLPSSNVAPPLRPPESA